MMKKCLYLISFIILSVLTANAQERFKIAFFSPLYLDSAFDASGNYRHNKSFPKHLNPGIEFYQGAQQALDSLQKRGAPLEVFVYDTRSNLNNIVNQAQFRDIDMIIAQTSAPETRFLADVALYNKIPFISTTLPNDVGISNNPYVVILNSTLQAHVEGIYRLVERKFPQQNIIIFRKNGTQEKMIKDHFIEYGHLTPTAPLKIKYVDLPANFTSQNLVSHLDSTKRNVIIAGSLEENFAQRLTQNLSSLNSKYPLSIIGMPNWENVTFPKSVQPLEIIYSTSFNYTRTSPLERRLNDDFLNTINGRPTDMYFRGYESMLRFSLLLLDTKQDVSSHLTRKGNYVFTQFDIQPVFKDKRSMTLDYFENKHLYFIKMQNGSKYSYY